jgi:hypothetical protein
MKLENFLFTFYMNCNAKKELSQHISVSRTLYVKQPHVASELRFGHHCSILYYLWLGASHKSARSTPGCLGWMKKQHSLLFPVCSATTSPSNTPTHTSHKNVWLQKLITNAENT